MEGSGIVASDQIVVLPSTSIDGVDTGDRSLIKFDLDSTKPIADTIRLISRTDRSLFPRCSTVQLIIGQTAETMRTQSLKALTARSAE